MAIFIGMRIWRDESFSYERFVYAFADYLGYKAQGLQDTYKGQLLVKMMELEWNNMSIKEQNRFLGNEETANQIKVVLRELNLIN